MLGRWQDSIEILVDLLSETEKPGPTVFELTLEALVAEEQVRSCAAMRGNRRTPLFCLPFKTDFTFFMAYPLSYVISCHIMLCYVMSCQ